MLLLKRVLSINTDLIHKNKLKQEFHVLKLLFLSILLLNICHKGKEIDQYRFQVLLY